MTLSTRDSDQRSSLGHLEVFKGVVENTPDLIARFGRDLRRVYVNPAIERLTGLPSSELVGRTMRELSFDPRFSDPIERALKEVFETGTERTLEVLLPSAEGERVYQARVVPELGTDSHVEFALVISRDITSIRRDQERLLTLTRENERLNRLVGLGRVAAATSHEFNNVLMGIQSFAELLMRSSREPRVTQAAERIIRSVRRGSGITQALRAFTAPKPPDRVSVDVHLWLSESLVELEKLVIAPVKLDVDIAGTRLMIEGDRDQLTLALRNLIGNAQDSIGRRNGTIRLSARLSTSPDGLPPHEEMVQLTVSDDGKGIEPENVPRLFEPFFTTKESGTGLGLAIANQIVTLHGGRLTVESEVGKGTTVRMLLPAAWTTADLPGHELRRSSERRRPTDILLVEDDEAVAIGLVTLLELEKVNVRQAADGAEALGLLASYKPQALVIDINLPDCTGFDLYGRIVAITGPLPVVFASGHAETSRMDGLDTSAGVRLLRKPYAIDTLLDTLEALVGEGA